MTAGFRPFRAGIVWLGRVPRTLPWADELWRLRRGYGKSIYAIGGRGQHGGKCPNSRAGAERRRSGPWRTLSLALPPKKNPNFLLTGLTWFDKNTKVRYLTIVYQVVFGRYIYET